MSVRSELRAQALERDQGCVWPDDDQHVGQLEMAHLQQSSQGGPDTLDNVAILCRFHHDCLDNRVVRGRRRAMLALLKSHMRSTGVVA